VSQIDHLPSAREFSPNPSISPENATRGSVAIRTWDNARSVDVVRDRIKKVSRALDFRNARLISLVVADAWSARNAAHFGRSQRALWRRRRSGKQRKLELSCALSRASRLCLHAHAARPREHVAQTAEARESTPHSARPPARVAPRLTVLDIESAAVLWTAYIDMLTAYVIAKVESGVSW